MSGVSIVCRPVTVDWSDSGGRGELFKALEELYGLPATLGGTQIPELRGMAACGADGAQSLIDAICEFGRIEVKAEY